MLVAVVARILVLVLLLCVSADARAQSPRRVALVGMDATLRDAVETALSPWGIELRVVDDRSVRNREMASRLAREVYAVAVIWVRHDERSAQLQMYDRVSGKVASLPLHAPPPYDAPTAAAVALNIKTLLRHSDAAPVRERLRVVAPTQPRKRPKQLYLEVIGAVSLPRNGAASAVPGGGASVVWVPTFAHSRLQFVAGYRYRGRQTIVTPDLDGSFLEHAAQLAAGGRLPLNGRVTLGADVGACVRMGRLEGAVTGRLEEVSVARLNPAVDLGAYGRFRLPGSIGIVLRGHSSLLVRRQSYVVGQQSVLAQPSLDFGVELAVSIPIY